MNSPCIEHLPPNRYRCRHLGVVWVDPALPIRCACGGKPTGWATELVVASQGRAPTPPGPGTHLARMIARAQRLLPWWDMQPHGGCGCDATARWMDRLGPDGCAAHLDEIVSRLEEEAAKRGIKFPFRRAVAKRMAKWAIRRARKGLR